ncbi:unnamed protein product [Owenia fusiformis]|uniref:KIND domain-containing protein n=1 Tax=Owenia fusiformis TaxID=6347 RepID=A0A8S4NC94_OWEFU|nr:unnamed protein product [Owenia fusiformis]
MAEKVLRSDKNSENNTEFLPLKRIAGAFNTSINEEQAWAVCFQCSQCLLNRWQDLKYCTINYHTIHVFKDGKVCFDSGARSTISGHGDPGEEEIVEQLGRAIYDALDHGLGENEERKLSRSLEDLIFKMTQHDIDGADEGIEEDHRISLAQVIQACEEHLGSHQDAKSHYKAVCRALVTEALELTSFLEKITKEQKILKAEHNESTEGEHFLEDLRQSDWARFWLQVMRDLRQGVKLKSVDSDMRMRSVEYELTPYEMLMEDIRARRYELRQVMAPDEGGSSQCVKDDAHAVILEFIRSRPPLKAVSDRKLKPPPEQVLNIREQLMNAIRKEHQLRPIPGKIVETSRTKLCEGDETPQPTRKLIKPDLTLLLSNSFDEDVDDDDDDDDDYDDSFVLSPSPTPEDERFKVTPCDFSPFTPPDGDPQSPWQQKVIDLTLTDLDTSRHSLERRHSITVCESPMNSLMVAISPFQAHLHKSSSLKHGLDDLTDVHKDKTILPNGRDDSTVTSCTQSGNKIDGSDANAGAILRETPERRKGEAKACQSTLPNKSTSKSHRKQIANFTKSLQNPLECLSLTVEEVMHIRNVLTKAELETLLTVPGLYESVARGKVCFNCRKVKFSLLGDWGTHCKFCKRKVCKKCLRQMQIPSEHFENIPVFALSPGLKTPKNKDLIENESSGSAPNSPRLAVKDISTPSPDAVNVNGHKAETLNVNTSNSNPVMQRWHKAQQLLLSPRMGRGSIESPLLAICTDCKDMICHVIRASRVTLANAPDTGTLTLPQPTQRKVNRNFHLKLKPVYKL